MKKEIIGAMVTPFNNQDEIDYVEVKKMLESYEKSGHSAVVVAGTTGEESALTSKEKIDLIKFVIMFVDKDEVKNGWI